MSDPAEIAELVGDAKIVAIGENNHHLHEFGELRNRLLRHLVEQHGFRVIGFESGFAEGKLVEEWLKGGPGDVADIGRDGFTFSFGESPEAHDMLTWLRERGDVHYYGLDVPGSAGSPVPSLDAVRAYLSTVDESATGLVDAAIEATSGYASVSSADAPAKYAALDAAAKDKATAALVRLKTHLISLRPVYGNTEAQTIAEHHADGALRVDTYLAEVAAMMSGGAPALQSGSRDLYMAESVRLIRRLHGDDTKIVVMLHNGHLQRVPFSPFPGLTAPSAGTHLAAEYGDDYFALALTAVGGKTTGLKPDPAARLGFTVYEQDLEAPADRSVESEGPGLVDLRARRGTEGPRSIRHAHVFNPVDVVNAFDALVCLPESTVSGHIGQDKPNG
ncbi:erythromycin esterase family protein [Amycolatopsis regifaucium]|uniref:Erythromycin esterase n=1 Tax=Amycolatopsis regifaucium TaxID=546365 RepID=A0A154MD29_9PSEU|nr:erythromycin esterase family protein [Amycolatopsis regifaucium]KZB82504.1 erythromycin esterase [Amycolatopsis regifaucium]OKA04758.1 erythromycin esterase [Amycolatopsis regifaucium]SFH31598.1 erythromycin esterase [Amycolatopsis regifaucium]